MPVQFNKLSSSAGIIKSSFGHVKQKIVNATEKAKKFPKEHPTISKVIIVGGSFALGYYFDYRSHNTPEPNIPDIPKPNIPSPPSPVVPELDKIDQNVNLIWQAISFVSLASFAGLGILTIRNNANFKNKLEALQREKNDAVRAKEQLEGEKQAEINQIVIERNRDAIAVVKKVEEDKNKLIEAFKEEIEKLRRTTTAQAQPTSQLSQKNRISEQKLTELINENQKLQRDIEELRRKLDDEMSKVNKLEDENSKVSHRRNQASQSGRDFRKMIANEETEKERTVRILRTSLGNLNEGLEEARTTILDIKKIIDTPGEAPNAALSKIGAKVEKFLGALPQVLSSPAATSRARPNIGLKGEQPKLDEHEVQSIAKLIKSFFPKYQRTQSNIEVIAQLFKEFSNYTGAFIDGEKNLSEQLFDLIQVIKKTQNSTNEEVIRQEVNKIINNYAFPEQVEDIKKFYKLRVDKELKKEELEEIYEDIESLSSFNAIFSLIENIYSGELGDVSDFSELVVFIKSKGLAREKNVFETILDLVETTLQQYKEEYEDICQEVADLIKFYFPEYLEIGSNHHIIFKLIQDKGDLDEEFLHEEALHKIKLGDFRGFARMLLGENYNKHSDIQTSIITYVESLKLEELRYLINGYYMSRPADSDSQNSQNFSDFQKVFYLIKLRYGDELEEGEQFGPVQLAQFLREKDEDNAKKYKDLSDLMVISKEVEEIISEELRSAPEVVEAED